jgi:hypothetical protein
MTWFGLKLLSRGICSAPNKTPKRPSQEQFNTIAIQSTTWGLDEKVFCLAQTLSYIYIYIERERHLNLGNNRTYKSPQFGFRVDCNHFGHKILSIATTS